MNVNRITQDLEYHDTPVRLLILSCKNAMYVPSMVHLVSADRSLAPKSGPSCKTTRLKWRWIFSVEQTPHCTFASRAFVVLRLKISNASQIYIIYHLTRVKAFWDIASCLWCRSLRSFLSTIHTPQKYSLMTFILCVRFSLHFTLPRSIHLRHSSSSFLRHCL